MTKPLPVMTTDLPLPARRTGKVRDIYQLQLPDGTPALAIVATDRVSAFDVIMANGIADKGVILTQIARFWFDHFSSQFNHHLISTDPADLPGLDDAQRDALRGRLMIGKRTQVIPVECVVRGYLAGSGWAEYQQSQTVCGVALPDGLVQCDRLPQPIFTPATKAEQGHDENITIDRAAELVGQRLIQRLRDQSVRLYSEAAAYAADRGIILADTKFEWGLPLDVDPQAIREGKAWAEPILIDEILTPDSSRFWPADQYQPGRDQPSFDKQFVRNYLQQLVDAGQWDKNPPGPTLPDDVVRGTLTRYRQAHQLLTGRTLGI